MSALSVCHERCAAWKIENEQLADERKDLRARLETAEADGAREALEKARAAQCEGCRLGHEYSDDLGGIHPDPDEGRVFTYCEAVYIRGVLAATTPPESKHPKEPTP